MRSGIPPDMADLSVIAHAGLPLIDPLDSDVVDDVVSRLALPPGARIVDIGCGKGELLIRIAERHAVEGLGVDLAAEYVEDARREAARRGVALEFRVADATQEDWGAAAFDLVCCVGASHALATGDDDAFGALAAVARPGGEVLLGDGFWQRVPSDRYLAALGATADELPDRAGLFAAAARAGLTPLYARETTPDAWDRYEWALILNAERFAAAHPDDPVAGPLRERARAARERYTGPDGRDTLGFGLFLFRREA
jgi:SAM-dependent methyltransferase